MSQIFYAIRQISTGHFLPAPTGQMRSSTCLEFTGDKPPRLFNTAGGASKSMRAWLKGYWRRETRDVSDHEAFSPIIEQCKPEPYKEVPSRDPGDIEVVELEIFPRNAIPLSAMTQYRDRCKTRATS